ncbi:MAG: LOG family protein [Ignavibacteriae bacterium]|nr:LOG family protein [Ignavibacteriota bacterium]
MTITIFGSSRPMFGEEEYQTAYELGKLLAQSGFTICNGGYGGTMEASARGASEAKGKTIGVVCERFGTKANLFIQETIVVKNHSDRLHKLVELGDAYVVLKGSTGTLVEFAMVWEYMNKSLLKEKPIIVVGDFWKPIVETFSNELVFEGKELATKFVIIVQTVRESVVLLKQKRTLYQLSDENIGKNAKMQ